MDYLKIGHGQNSADTIGPGAGTRPANWVVSYPRSGNTFARSLIANYFSGFDRPLTLDELSQSTRGEHNEEVWDAVTGKKPADRSFELEWRARQPYFERVRGITNQAMPLIKSHTVLTEISKTPAFPFVPGDRIINIVRHPCDVAISTARFNAMELEEAIERMLLPNRCVIGHPHIGYEFIGSWSQHVRSWMQETVVPILRVRYSDLIGSSVQTLMNIVAFLNFEPDLARARLAVDHARFDRMRAEEQEKGFVEAPKQTGQPFFREGRQGQWLDVLTVNQARKILSTDPELITYFGFEKLPAT